MESVLVDSPIDEPEVQDRGSVESLVLAQTSSRVEVSFPAASLFHTEGSRCLRYIRVQSPNCSS